MKAKNEVEHISGLSNYEKGDDGPKKPGLLKTFVFLAVMVSTGLYVGLYPNKNTFLAVLIAFSILEVADLYRKFKLSTPLDAVCELLYVIVFGSVCLAIFRSTLHASWSFLFATMIYRPYFTLQRNRGFALVISVLIVVVVLPVTLGIAETPASVGLLTAAYCLLVGSLWAFCSKLGALIFNLSSD